MRPDAPVVPGSRSALNLHLGHPKFALWPRNCVSFLTAGKSAVMAIKAALIECELSEDGTPFHS